MMVSKRSINHNKWRVDTHITFGYTYVTYGRKGNDSDGDGGNEVNKPGVANATGKILNDNGCIS